jgi:hypothetical protein
MNDDHRVDTRRGGMKSMYGNLVYARRAGRIQNFIFY